MSQTFSCPSCGAPLDYGGNGASTITCPYCYTSVIVPQELRSQRSEPVAPDVTQSLAGQAANLRQLSSLVRIKQRDQAVALYQQIYHVDTVAAQQLVDQLMAGSPMVITSNMGWPMSGVSVSTTSGYPSATGIPSPTGYTVPPTAAMYTMSANVAAQQSRRWLWYFGCVFAFVIFITVVTTIIPLILAFGGMLIPFFIR